MTSAGETHGGGEAEAHAGLSAEAVRSRAEALEFVPDGFITLTADGIIESANARAAAICGMPAQELIGRSVREVLSFQDMEGNSYWDVLDPVKTLHITTGHRERMLMLPSGRVVLVTARYLRRPDGSLFACTLGMRDAAGRMRAERQMTDLIATIAHELKSPIASMTGFTDTLLRHWDRFADADKQVMLRTIQDDGARVMRLVTDLLDVSWIDSGSLTLNKRPVDLAATCAAQVARRVARGESEDRFDVEVPDGLPELWADPDRFEQILTNLVDNALRHGAGQVRLRAGVADVDGEAGVVLRVCDEGDGIPEENRELVFSRYWQGGSRAGTGIGLFIVRGLVEAHGGTVQVGEHDGGGARIEVLLPAGEPEHLRD